MKKVLLTVMFVLSLFIMCSCGEENRRGDRDSERWDQDRHSEQDRSDRYQERNTEPREERHEEQR